MSNDEYIKVTNKASIVLANDALRYVTGGDRYGVDNDVLEAIRENLSIILERLFKEIKVDGDNK